MKLLQGFGVVAASNLAAAPESFDLIATQSVSAVSSFSIDNCFSADYDHYMINQALDATNNSDTFLFRMRAGGVDATTNYAHQIISATNTSVTASRNTAYTYFNMTTPSGTGADANRPINYTIVSNPFDAVFTTCYTISTLFVEDMGNVRYSIFEQSHKTATSYDGMSFIVTGGTVTGNLQVYGWKV